VRNPFKRKPNDILVTQVYEELAYALQDGDAIESTIELLISEIEEAALVSLFEKIRQKLQHGESPGNAIAGVTREATDFPARLIDNSQPRDLSSSFRILAGLKQRESSLRAVSPKSLYYPLILVAALVLLLYFIAIFVIPPFHELFASFGAELPALTQLLFSASGFDFWTALWPVFLLIVFFPAYRKIRLLKRPIDRFILRMPVFGKHIRAFHLNEFLNRVFLLHGAGRLDDRQILELSSAGIANTYLRERAESLAGENDLLRWLKQSDVVPPRARRILSRSADKEQTWLDFETYLDFQTRRLDEQIGGSLSQLVVVLTGTIYILVALFIISVYLPIFRLGSLL